MRSRGAAPLSSQPLGDPRKFNANCPGKMTKITFIAILISSLLLNVILIFRYLYISESKMRSILINLSILIFSTLYIGLIFEVVFYNFMVESDGFAFTLASGRWFQRYWKPINSLGYRDENHSGDEGKSNLFIVGDSFVAGHGIENYQDRFSNLLAEELGEEWAVHNIANGNWSTQDEYQALREYRFKPDIVIISYFINDIEGAAREAGEERPSLINPPPKLVASIINQSFFVNFVYWRVYRYRFAEEMREAYFGYLARAFSDPFIWEMHQEELRELIRYANINGAEIIFILFPNLADVDGSSEYTARVRVFLEGEGVEVIDLGPKLIDRPSEDLVVSPIDAHPSILLHQEVAELLCDSLQEIRR